MQVTMARSCCVEVGTKEKTEQHKPVDRGRGHNADLAALRVPRSQRRQAISLRIMIIVLSMLLQR